MIRTLIPDSGSILHTPAELVDLSDPDRALSTMQALAVDLFETMGRHEGLAAVQIGVPLRAFVMRTPNRMIFAINPSVLLEQDAPVNAVEGCLSYPDIYYTVPRSTRIKVEYWDEALKRRSHYMNDWNARVFQHECDHVNGIVMSERGVLYVPD